MATPGELFSEEILSCLYQEDSENKLDILMLLAVSQQRILERPQQQQCACVDYEKPAATTTAAVLHASLH